MGIYCHLDQMQRELSRPFKVQAASLKRIQLHFGQSVSEWYSALPRAAKSGHGQLKELVCPFASLPHVCTHQHSMPVTLCSRICVAQRMHCNLRQCFCLKCLLSHADSHISKLPPCNDVLLPHAGHTEHIRSASIRGYHCTRSQRGHILVPRVCCLLSSISSGSFGSHSAT